MSGIFTIFVSNPLGSSPSRKVHLGSPLWLPTALPEPLLARICTQKLILTLWWSVHGPVLRRPGLEMIFTYRNRLLTHLAPFCPPTPSPPYVNAVSPVSTGEVAADWLVYSSSCRRQCLLESIQSRSSPCDAGHQQTSCEKFCGHRLGEKDAEIEGWSWRGVPGQS